MAGIDEEFDPSAPLDPFSITANMVTAVRATADESETDETVVLLLDIIDTLLDELREVHFETESRLETVEYDIGHVQGVVSDLPSETL